MLTLPFSHLSLSAVLSNPSIYSGHIYRYGNGAGNTVEENSIVFSLIRMR